MTNVTRYTGKSAFTIGLLFVLMSVPAFAASVNKGVKVEPGATADGATSVNGSITIGEYAVVTGNVKTVNGTIRVDDGARLEEASTVNGGVRIANNVQSQSLATVNGSIKVGESATVGGAIEAVNGGISVKRNSTVALDVSNVNGEIDLSGTAVGGDVSTVTGDVLIVDGSVIQGDLIVKKPSSWGWGKGKRRKPKIVIGPGSRVAGTIELEREVELYISQTAEVGAVSGVMNLDDAVRFSGERP